MKQGKKKFDETSQGARARQGQLCGEEFIEEILKILGITNIKKKIKKKFEAVVEGIKSKMVPDFIVEPSNTSKDEFGDIDFLFLESKFKQIAGSDWEKIESNFGFHEYFYNDLCGANSKTIVILSGYWKELQKNYHCFYQYFQQKYGKNSIFDFGESVDEIFRFAKLMDVNITDEMRVKIEKLWKDSK